MDWKSLAIGTLGSLIAAFLVYLFARSRGWVRFSLKRWRHQRSVFKRLKASGLSNYYASRSDYAKYRGTANLIDYLKTARHTVTVCAYWMAHGNEAEGIAQEIADMVCPPNSRKVTIAVIDPTGTCIPELANYLGILQNELVMRIQSSLTNLHNARSRLSPDLQKRLMLKVYSTIPIASVIILDGDTPDGRIQIDIKPYRVPRNFSFSFEVAGPGSNLYDLCLRAWGNLVADAVEFDPRRHIAASSTVRGTPEETQGSHP